MLKIIFWIFCNVPYFFPNIHLYLASGKRKKWGTSWFCLLAFFVFVFVFFFTRGQIKRIWTILSDVIDCFNRNLRIVFLFSLSTLLMEIIYGRYYFWKTFYSMKNLMARSGKTLPFLSLVRERLEKN